MKLASLILIALFMSGCSTLSPMEKFQKHQSKGEVDEPAYQTYLNQRNWDLDRICTSEPNRCGGWHRSYQECRMVNVGSEKELNPILQCSAEPKADVPSSSANP